LQFATLQSTGSGAVSFSASKKYWGIVADNLSKAGWSLGYVSTFDSNGRTIWIADAYRDDGKRFVAHADEKLTAFVELESATRSSIDRSRGCSQ
jgi:hypothetical protein